MANPEMGSELPADVETPQRSSREWFPVRRKEYALAQLALSIFREHGRTLPNDNYFTLSSDQVNAAGDPLPDDWVRVEGPAPDSDWSEFSLFKTELGKRIKEATGDIFEAIGPTVEAIRHNS